MDTSTNATPLAGRVPANPATAPRQPEMWAAGGLLRPGSGSYVGHVIVESWSDGRALSTVSGLGQIRAMQGTLTALRSSSRETRTRVTLPDGPMMSRLDSGGATFLGRVIVEFWTTESVVGVFGSDIATAERHAVDHLTSLSAGQGAY